MIENSIKQTELSIELENIPLKYKKIVKSYFMGLSKEINKKE